VLRSRIVTLMKGRIANLASKGQRRFSQFFAVALIAFPIAACSSLFGDKDALPPDQPADKLYNEGLYLMDQRQEFKDATKKFEEVERQHPYSEWARKALIMAAYCHYQVKEYEEAIASAKRYITLHPGSPDAAYAQYIVGSAYYDQIVDINRDQARTDKAIQSLDEVVRKFPNTEYAVSAKRKMDIARDQLAGREMMVGRYYMDKKDYTGAINRFKIVVTQYQTTRHVEEALMRLTESYMTLGIVPEAQTAAAVLGHNFPDSVWYQDAYKLVKSNGLEPAENKDSWISRAFSKIAIGGPKANSGGS
jgi:outer membrane protein assembly factor BamD